MVSDFWYIFDINIDQKFCKRDTWELPKKELDYAIYAISLSTLKDVIFMQYRYFIEESRVYVLLLVILKAGIYMIK